MAPQTSHKKSFKVAVPVLYVPENAGNFRLVVRGVTAHVQTIPRLWPLWWPQLWAHLLVVPVISYGSSYFHLQCSDSGTSGSSHAWDWSYPCTWLSSTPVWSTTQAGCCGPTDYTQHKKADGKIFTLRNIDPSWVKTYSQLKPLIIEPRCRKKFVHKTTSTLHGCIQSNSVVTLRSSDDMQEIWATLS